MTPDAPFPAALMKVNLQAADPALLQLVAEIGQAVLNPALPDADLRATILEQTPRAVLQPLVERCVREIDRRNPYGPGRALRPLRTVPNLAGVSEVAWAPDGHWIALGGDGGLWLWAPDAPRGPVALPKSWGVYALAFAPDSQTLAVARSGAVDLVRLPDGARRARLPVGEGFLQSLAWSGDGQALVTTSRDAVRWWAWPAGELRATTPVPTQGDRWREARTTVLTAAGQTLVAGYGSQVVWRWHAVPTGRQTIRRLPAEWMDIRGVAFAPDGTQLAAASVNEGVWIWRVADGRLLRKLGADQASAVSLAWSPDGHLLAAGAEWGGMWLWRVADGFLLNQWEGHAGDVSSLAFAPDGRALVSVGGFDETVRVWEVPG